MKTTLLMIVTLIFGAMLLVSFQNGNNLPNNSASTLETLEPNPEADLKAMQLVDHFINYPDPFCGVTTIQYEITESTWVKLSVTCPNQNELVLVNESQKPGMFKVAFDACKLPCGQYIATLITDYSREKEIMTKNKNTIVKPPISD